MDRRGSVLWCMVIVCTCVVVSGVVPSKAFFCRDPDTGKLHPVNSTWYSSSMCGKYTCKLRKKEQEKPVTHQKFDETTNKSATKKFTQPTSITVSDKPNGDEKYETNEGKQKYKINLEKFKKVNESKNIQQPASTLDEDRSTTSSSEMKIDEDRYLSEKEVKALSFLLQAMKKGDLEAILEVYNLAQDIYKELDEIDVAQKVMVDEKSNDSKTVDSAVVNKKTYWYDPSTAASSKKIKEAAEIVDVQNAEPQVQTTPVSAKIMPTDAPKKNYVGFNALQKISDKPKESERKPKTKMEEQEFFERPLARNFNMRMLPYYYHPLTNFQKLASYIRPKATIAQSPNYSPSELYFQAGWFPTAFLQLPQYSLPTLYSNQPKEVQKAYQMQHQKLAEKIQYFNPQHKIYVKPENPRTHGKCSKSKPSYKEVPRSEFAKITDAIGKRKTYSNLDKTYEQKDALSLAESKLTAAHNLDLPFAYQQNYNASKFNPHNSEKVWTMFRLDTKSHKPPPQRGYLAHIARDDTLDTVVNEEIKEEIRSIEGSKEIQNSNQLPDWQTGPLSISDLNEVKANISRSKFLPYPFRRKIALKRVGRIRNIQDGERTKRDVKKDNEIDIEASQQVYEVYIEQSTCHTDTEPGFFRMGNASEPFPGCCPQRISS